MERVILIALVLVEEITFIHKGFFGQNLIESRQIADGSSTPCMIRTRSTEKKDQMCFLSYADLVKLMMLHPM